ELRGFHLKTADGPVEGKAFIDPVWARIVAWNSDNVPRVQRDATRDQVAALLKDRPDGAALLRRFDELADRVDEPAAA
ncbi:MAG TPA: hypothetical protein VGG29_19030, partial [Caulobacteraceae bacterium]